MAGETLRERVARAAARADYQPSDGSDAWDVSTEAERDGYREIADAVLAVVAEDVDGFAEVLRVHQPQHDFDGDYQWCRNDACEIPRGDHADHQAAMVTAHIGAQS